MTDTTAALETPAAPAADAAAAPAAAAPAAGAEAAAETLITPESVQGDAAAADGQGDAEGATAQSGASDGQGASGEEGAEAPQGAPDAYADFALPEGFALPADLSESLTTLAKELNLPQAKAQKLIDLGIAHAQKVQGSMTEALATAKTQWADAVRADPVLGGANLNANMATAKKAIVAFGTPALTGFLNQTGLGQHPEFLRLLVNVGAAISEDTIENGGQGPSGAGRGPNRDHAKSLYPGMK